MDAVEEELAEYWCTWTSNSLSAAETNWIPTNWPARTVHCLVVLTTAGVTNIIAFPDWSPAEPHTLDLWIYKSSVGAGVIRSANGTDALSAIGTSGIFSKCVCSFIPGFGWIIARYGISQPPAIIGNKKGWATNLRLPEDAAFAPVMEPPNP